MLTAEYKQVEAELKTVGRVNPSNPADWEATSKVAEDTADENLVANSMDKYEENTALLNQLEIRFNEIKQALERIKAGTYGVCKVCGKEIETERLEANSAAETCTEHKS